ncbi:hypothetical protein [Mucilaginibacter sp.]|uniref:hypothetical protein n=1 Tax=Mucilaginibacter sp. TaxID=1882438 RepID=UPI0035BBB5FA
MDQYIDNRHKEILYDLLANPADTGRLHVATLERMVHDNPQSGLLQVLLARAGENDDVKKAAAYFKPGTLHKLLYNADNLPFVAPGRIINAGSNLSQSYFSAAPVAEQAEPANADQEQDTPAAADSYDPDTVIVPQDDEQQPAWVDQHLSEVDIPTLEQEEFVAKADQEEEIVTSEIEPATATEIDEEVHEEIQSADHIIPELYASYKEQLVQAAAEPIPADEQSAEEPGIIIPELYNSYQEQLAHPEAEQTATVEEQLAEQPDTIVPELYNSYQEQIAITDEAKQDEVEGAFYETTPAVHAPVKQEPAPRGEDIDEEVYDEIVGIDDIGFTSTVNVLHESEELQPQDADTEGQTWENTFSDEDDYPEDEEEEDERPLQLSKGLTDRDIAIDEEKLILGNIVSADYLMFDKKLDELRNSEPANDQAQEQEPDAAQTATAPEPVKEQEVLSRYNDDTMPYSFMWWLDKTRKEHAGTFQPYVANPVPKQVNIQIDSAVQPEHQRVKPVKRKAPDELQQQYFENIFSLTSVSGIERDDEEKGIAFDHNRKEDVIIERFIHNEPQIRAPAADRLDNENKAKRSSEDQDVMVTETLARIYTDQMLYHKAIATYKKLVLKFPEKKLYFAAQIEQLEKKTN